VFPVPDVLDALKPLLLTFPNPAPEPEPEPEIDPDPVADTLD
jgi:hypothetical protein